jgi:general stress protein CsbA
VKDKELQDELVSIRNLMERSSKFISLSGLSGILAGVYALAGAGVAYYITNNDFKADGSLSDFFFLAKIVPYLIGIALTVLVASLLTGLVLTYQKAKRKGQSVWGKSSKALLFHMAVPLVTGGVLIIIFVYRGYFGIVAPASLIFYGLSLISASNFTFTDVKYLGLIEIILGLIAACFPGYGLLFWAIGFGVLHIVYGIVMYLKYDR